MSLTAALAAWHRFYGADARKGTDRINVLLISMDTVRKDHLSCYGYPRPTTPHLDALATEGLLFRRCVAVSNWTLPTHASMLCGLYPSTHGAHLIEGEPTSSHKGVPGLAPAGAMHQSCVTLAEILSGQQYRTAAIVANALYLQKAHHLDQGFDLYDDRCGCPVCRKIPPGVEPPVPYRTATEITDEAIDWLSGGDRSRPFFLFLNYMDAHEPYFPPPAFRERFRDEQTGRVEKPAAQTRRWGPELNWYRSWRDWVHKHRSPPPPDVSAWLRSQYDGELAYLDEQLGRLFDYLRERGLYDRTIIVVTSDHGESFGEHGLMSHGMALYEPEVAVPMIVKLPFSRRAGEQIDDGVQHVDIMPTVLEVLDLPTPNVVQGRSMLRPSERDLFVEHYVNVEHARTWPQFHRRQWALYRGDRKLIEYDDGEFELYDVKRDPAEAENLLESNPSEVQSLRDALASVREAVKPATAAEPARDLRAETVQQLRDLGYAQ